MLFGFPNEAGLPWVDLIQAYAAGAARFKGTTDEYLAQYFIGHYCR